MTSVQILDPNIFCFPDKPWDLYFSPAARWLFTTASARWGIFYYVELYVGRLAWKQIFCTVAKRREKNSTVLRRKFISVWHGLAHLKWIIIVHKWRTRILCLSIPWIGQDFQTRNKDGTTWQKKGGKFEMHSTNLKMVISDMGNQKFY